VGKSSKMDQNTPTTWFISTAFHDLVLISWLSRPGNSEF